MSEIQPISGFNDRTKLASAVPLPFPYTLNIFPTNMCNFRCNYCGQSLGPRAFKERYPYIASPNMTLETLENIIMFSKEFGGPYKLVSFNGHGEPLIHPSLPEMIAKIKNAGIAERIEIITNASLLTPDLSRKLVGAGVDNLRVSLQGLSSQKYEEICGRAIDFDAFLENIAYYHNHASERGAKIFVKIVDTALTQGEQAVFFKMFDDISDRMFIERVQPVYEGVAYDNAARRVLVDRYGNEHQPRMACPLPFYMLNIWPDGSVAPCDAIYRPIVLGNCNIDSLADIWQSQKLLDFQLQILKGKDNIVKCGFCCAPDDVSHAEDVLDEDAEKLISLLKTI
jgi:MoaA/NifB/PqqE/SkfB family radical SAM enzyme